MKLSRKLDHQLKSKEFDQSFTGFALYDINKKKYLLEHNSNKYFTPASNVKLLTYYASLKELDDSIPGIRYYSTSDSLIFWGSGDPSFLDSRFTTSKVFDFLKNSSANLFLTSQLGQIPPLGSGWAWDDYNDSYSAERSQFPVYGNLVNFKMNTNNSLLLSNPSYFSEELIENKSLSFQIKRDLNSNTFRYKLISKPGKLDVFIPFKTSVSLTAKLLTDTLAKPVTLIKRPQFPQDKNIKTIYSLESDSLYKAMLQESDNFIAEQLLLLISEKISDTLDTNIAIKHIQSTYLQNVPDEIKWVDGSGLSRYNLLTPRTLIYILDQIFQEVPKEQLFQLLPAGGKNGTLKNLYNAEAPYVFAKTGTLRNNHALSGYLITKRGKILAFSFMNNNYVISSTEIKKAMEMILITIRDSY